MMKHKLYLTGILLVLGIFLQSPQTVVAQNEPSATEAADATETLLVPEFSDERTFPTTPPEFFQAEVLQVLSTDSTELGGYNETQQSLELELSTGEKVIATNTLPLGSGSDRLIERGDKVVVVAQTLADGEPPYYVVTDVYRLPSMLLVLGLFIFVIIVLSGVRGVTSLSGLAFSILLLMFFVVPQIAGGSDPVVISLISSVFIGGVALYLAHGFNIRTTLSLISTMLTLVLAVVAAFSFVSLTSLFGLGSEESLELQYGAIQNINLRGLLLAGIIIGALGVLDDITTAQTAAVAELKLANDKLSFEELYKRGMAVGREHITSLVNTLALAYAGASLPMLLLFTVYQQPLWVTLNSEFVVEEVVRTVVGSLALTVAVPITTFIAAYWFSKPETKITPSSSRHKH